MVGLVLHGIGWDGTGWAGTIMCCFLYTVRYSVGSVNEREYLGTLKKLCRLSDRCTVSHTNKLKPHNGNKSSFASNF